MIGFASCETIVDLDLPEHKPVLVTNSIINADSAIVVRVSNSVSVLDNGSPAPVNNATVEIYKDGNYVGTLPFIGEDTYLDPAIVPVPGSTYTLKASAPNYNPVSASTTIPASVQISSISIRDSVQGSETYHGNSVAEVSLTFTDPPAAGNYYYLEMYVSDSLTGSYYPTYIYTASENSGTSVMGGLGVMISDELINGNTYTMKVFTDSYNVAGLYTSNPFAFMIFRLRSITKEYYLYEKTLELQQQTNGNPFSEPVQVYGNIDGGYGIFAGYSADTLMVR